MRKIEREEDKLPFETADNKVFHLCIVNLVIGYAEKERFAQVKEYFLYFIQNTLLRKEQLRIWYCTRDEISRALSKETRNRYMVLHKTLFSLPV